MWKASRRVESDDILRGERVHQWLRGARDCKVERAVALLVLLMSI